MNKYFSLVLLLLGPMLARAQVFTPLGKGMTDEIVCSFLDDKGMVYVGHRAKVTDSISFSKWDPSTTKWTFLNKIENNLGTWSHQFTRCVVKNDSLFVSTYFKNAYRLIFISSSKVVPLALITGGYIEKMFVMHNSILALGSMDSVSGTKNNARGFKALWFDGSLWKTANFIYPTDIYNAAGAGDTVLALSGNKAVQFTYPNTWKVITSLGTKASQEYGGIAKIPKNGFMLTKRFSDSFFFWNGTNVTRKKSTVTFIGNTKMGADRYGLAVVCHQKKVYTYDWGKNVLLEFYGYPQSSFDSGTSVIGNDSDLYFHTYRPIKYNNVRLGKIVKLNLSFAKSYGYDTVLVNVFWDKNKNLVKDGKDTVLNDGIYLIGNETYEYYLSLVNGKFKDVIPDYNDAEYEFYFNGSAQDTCLKTPFTGNVMSRNTRSGVTLDTVTFPVRRTSLYLRNLILGSWSPRRARVQDTSILYFNVYNNDCDFNTSTATLTVDLEPNTVFIKSVPAHASYSGNKVTINLNSIDPYQYNTVKLYVVYPSAKFNINDTVMHRAKLTPSFADDTTDNSGYAVMVIKNSWDPNMKISYPEGIIKKELKQVDFYIHFQNEGNDDARRVTVIDTLDTKMPVYEYQMIGATHPYTVSIRGNVVTWVFDNIGLKPKSVNDALSKGHLAFRAKVNALYKSGDSIRNRAGIYFDYNPVVMTNYAVILRKDSTASLAKIQRAQNLVVFPNPAESYVTVQNTSAVAEEIAIFSIQGNMIWKGTIDGLNNITIPITSWAPGMYFVKGGRGQILKLTLR